MSLSVRATNFPTLVPLTQLPTPSPFPPAVLQALRFQAKQPPSGALEEGPYKGLNQPRSSCTYI